MENGIMKEPRKSLAEAIVKRATDVTAWIACAVIILMMLLVVWEVFMRYLFNEPSRWISDFVSEYLIIYVTMIPAGWILLGGGHVNVDLFISFLRPKQRHKMRVVTNFLGLVYSIVLTWQGWLYMWRELKFSTTFPTQSMLPVWPAVGAVFIGGLFLCLAFLLNIAVDLWLKRREPSYPS